MSYLNDALSVENRTAWWCSASRTSELLVFEVGQTAGEAPSGVRCRSYSAPPAPMPTPMTGSCSMHSMTRADMAIGWRLQCAALFIVQLPVVQRCLKIVDRHRPQNLPVEIGRQLNTLHADAQREQNVLQWRSAGICSFATLIIVQPLRHWLQAGLPQNNQRYQFLARVAVFACWRSCDCDVFVVVFFGGGGRLMIGAQIRWHTRRLENSMYLSCRRPSAECRWAWSAPVLCCRWEN